MAAFIDEILKPFHRFQVKVTVAMILSLLFVAALSNILIYQFALNAQFNALRDRLTVIAKISALMVDPEVLEQVPLNKEGINSPAYKIIAENLRKIKSDNPLITYNYIMSKTEKPGVWQFWVDPEPEAEPQKGDSSSSYPGDRYNASRFREMMKAFDGAAADKKLEVEDRKST